MKSWIRRLAMLATGSLLIACGGGGGDSGSSLYGGGSGGTSTSGGGTGTTAAYVMTVAVQRAGVAVTSITSTETVQVTATVKTTSGAAVPGAVVSFSENNAKLLQFAPSSATALTGSNGVATLDLAALNSSAVGATTVAASVSLSATVYSASRSIEIKAGSVGSAAAPKAINFVSVNPADRSIVIKGAGGNGRTESATLTFKVVDGGGAPVQDAKVNFSINPANQATLNIPSAVSNSDGLVTTTVQSGSVATSVVVTATAEADSSVSTPSDTLIVSNGTVVQSGFELVAEKYNLDGHLTGDKAKVTVFARDQFGNPVPDGLAVTLTTDYGVIGTSNLGGCVTANGTCTTEFKVQNPRGTGIATIVGSVRVDASTVVSDAIQINMAGATSSSYLAQNQNGSALNGLTLSGCKVNVALLMTDGNDHAVAAGSTIAIAAPSAGMTVSVVSGSPVADQLQAGFPGTLFVLGFDLGTKTTANNQTYCSGVGAGATSGEFWFQFKTPNNLIYNGQRVTVNYPAF